MAAHIDQIPLPERLGCAYGFRGPRSHRKIWIVVKYLPQDPLRFRPPVKKYDRLVVDDLIAKENPAFVMPPQAIIDSIYDDTIGLKEFRQRFGQWKGRMSRRP